MTSVEYDINGTPLADLTRWYAQLDGATSTPPLRGENTVVGGRVGQVFTAKTPDANVLSLGMVVLGSQADGSVAADQQAYFHENWRALRRLLWSPDAPLEVTRRVLYPSGTVTTQAQAELLPGSLTAALDRGTTRGKTTVDLLILDGYFYDADPTVFAPGTFTVGGDVRTRRITVTLPGAGTLANAALGTSVTVNAATVLDVEAMTSSAGLGVVTDDGSADWWLEAVAGSNTVTWSGAGSPSLSICGAHL